MMTRILIYFIFDGVQNVLTLKLRLCFDLMTDRNVRQQKNISTRLNVVVQEMKIMKHLNNFLKI